MFSRPSRSYASVEHDTEGLSSVTTQYMNRGLSNGGFKTYRPSIESRVGRIHSHDPSSSSIPPALRPKSKRALAEEGQQAELDVILEPEYKFRSDPVNGESSSMAQSRSQSSRTAGGIRGGSQAIKNAASMSSFRNAVNGSKGGNVSGKGVYVDRNGRTHDSEYDPFRGVSEMSRKQSRRKSAFGSTSKKESGSDTNSEVSNEADGDIDGTASRRSMDSTREEAEARKRLELERKRLDSGHAFAKRRSVISERSGRGTPSIRSSEENDRYTIQSSIHSGMTAPTRSRSQQGGPHYRMSSPLAPTFEDRQQGNGQDDEEEQEVEEGKSKVTELDGGQSNGYRARAGTGTTATTMTSEGGEEPRKVTENTLLPPMSPPSLGYPTSPTTHRPLSPNPGIIPNKAKTSSTKGPTREKVEIRKDGSKKITGFDAPSSPMPMPQTFNIPSANSSSQQLDVPNSARSAVSGGSRGSSEHGRSHVSHSYPATGGDRNGGDGDSIISQVRRPKPAERPREELFPETPAQAKQREERQRKKGLISANPTVTSRYGPNGSLVGSSNLAVDTVLASTLRRLPEIQIIEDNDPRIVFNPNGPATRVQKITDHILKPPNPAFAQEGTGSGEGSRSGSPVAGGTNNGARRPSSIKSTPFSIGSGRSQGVIDEGAGGYLPTRWANGDKQLRVTEEDKEMYRPKEWGGKYGQLGGRPEDWKPDVKDTFKRTWKDVQTSARISLFRAKKKLDRA